MAERPRDPAPPDALRALAGELEREAPRALYVLNGPERFFREEMARRIRAACLERGFEACAHDLTDPDFDFARLLDDLLSGALFAAARCVLVENAGTLVGAKAGDRGKAFLDAVKKRVGAAGGGTIVVGVESLAPQHALRKLARACGGAVIGCRKLWDGPPPWDPDPRRAEVVLWLLQEAREARVALSPDEAAFVVAATGNDPYALRAQLGRLRERGAGELRRLVGWDAGASPFEVAEHLARGDAARAVGGIEALYAGGYRGRDGARVVDGGALGVLLLNALTGKLREAALAADVLGRGGDFAAASRAAGLRGGPRALPELEARVKARPRQSWRLLLDEVGELERRSRSGATIDATDFALLALRWRRRTLGT